MRYDATTLHAELLAAGLSIEGCAGDGRIDWLAPPTPAQLAASQTVLAAHDPEKRLREEAARLAEARGLTTRFASLAEPERRRLLELLAVRLFGAP